MNRLAEETSPYLRQHRDNPVDWYPWGEEAFAAAARRDVPILLSIGYSACHWCHVMAHESFEDEPTAAVMNELFVCVKVDREERPDVDAIYMDAVVALTRHGGWPMTVFLTPDGEPFFGGTYFPRERFVDLMRQVDAAWTQQREDVVEQGRQLAAGVDRVGRVRPGEGIPSLDVLDRAFAHLNRQFDAEWGGFGAAPKFPNTMNLELLLRWHVRTGSGTALEMVTRSLDAMAAGGIYDHVGGGFARYAVDREWTVPHFEKMLYDQALLARVYLHGWKVTGDPRYLQVLEETIEYVGRDLRHPDGGFHSAEDADSEGEEGRFYVWSSEEMREVLGGAAEAASAWWGVSDEGNFEGHNILRRAVGAELRRPPVVEAARQALFAHREQRVRPGLDDKVLTEWNALMLATLAEAAAATGDEGWLAMATTNAEFLVENLRRSDRRWLRSWQDGRARHLAYAADHAALVDAFTRLAEATGESRWIDHAVETASAMIELFWDDERGGLYTGGHDAERLIARPKDLQDNATPAANSIAAVALLRLWALTGRDELRQRAEGILALVGDMMAEHPTAFSHLAGALQLLLEGPTEIVIPGDRPDLVAEVHRRHLPTAVLAWGQPYASPLWEGRAEGQAYVCQGFACEPPAADPATLSSQLDRMGAPR